MSINPGTLVSHEIAQRIVDRAVPGQAVIDVSKMLGGEIAAVYEIVLAEEQPPLILKVYPESLHWKMRKEANVIATVGERIHVPILRVLLVDDSK
jgi:hypothetical protein